MATATSYKSPAYDEEKYRQGINTEYYTNAVNQYRQQAEENRQRQLNEAQKTQQSGLQQAYINRLQNERKLKNNLAQQGIRGGASETAQIRLANQYGAERANANTNYSNSVNQINQNIDQNIRDYQSDMDSRAEEYRQNLAQARWQADREDTTNEQARQTEYWSNYYMNYYSGMKKKKAQKAVKELEKQLETVTDPYEKIRIEQAIAGAKARIGVIRNK